VFTGIIEGIGAIEEVSARVLKVKTDLEPLGMGESIAVDGVCLTVTAWESGAFVAELSEETLRRTTLGELAAGRTVNLERPMAASARFGGHIVQGHVDGVGRITAITEFEGSREVSIEVPTELGRYLVTKGSVAVDGVSLTVAGLDGVTFKTALIPQTLSATTLDQKTQGNRVNIEVDIIAKYVERLMNAGKEKE
jgi:riboflavin synthase